MNDKINKGSMVGGVVWGIVLLVTALLMLFVMQTMSSSESTTESELQSSFPEVRYEVKSMDIQKVYKKNLLPVIGRASDRNDAARKRSIQVVHTEFNRYRAGIPDFIEDLEGWGSKFSMVSKISQDKWNKWWNDESSQELAQYIREKFEKHIVGSSELDHLIKDSIVMFADDLLANRNQMLAEMKISLMSDDVPVAIKMSESEWTSFLSNYEKELDVKLKSYGGDAVMYPVLSCLTGECLSFGLISTTQASMKVVAPIMATFGTWLASSMSAVYATTAASSGGSTVICSMSGGAAGSSAGPFGTVTGIVVGLAVGWAVDCYFEKRFEEKMTIELTTVLNQLENSIVNGHQDKPGLDNIYAEINNKIEFLSREASLETLHQSEED